MASGREIRARVGWQPTRLRKPQDPLQLASTGFNMYEYQDAHARVHVDAVTALRRCTCACWHRRTRAGRSKATSDLEARPLLPKAARPLLRNPHWVLGTYMTIRFCPLTALPCFEKPPKARRIRALCAFERRGRLRALTSATYAHCHTPLPPASLSSYRIRISATSSFGLDRSHQSSSPIVLAPFPTDVDRLHPHTTPAQSPWRWSPYSTQASPSRLPIIRSTPPTMQIKALLMPRVIRFLLISTIRIVGIVAICLVIGAEIQEIVRYVWLSRIRGGAAHPALTLLVCHLQQRPGLRRCRPPRPRCSKQQ